MKTDKTETVISIIFFICILLIAIGYIYLFNNTKKTKTRIECIDNHNYVIHEKGIAQKLNDNGLPERCVKPKKGVSR